MGELRRWTMRRKQRRFSREFKREAVELLNRSGSSALQVSKELGIDSTTLSRWRREIGDGSDDAEREPTSVFALKEELKWLRKENERLKEEHAILKKAAAYFAKESL
jgi:transposase